MIISLYMVDSRSQKLTHIIYKIINYIILLLDEVCFFTDFENLLYAFGQSEKRE